MTLLQRISRNVRNAILLCPRTLRYGGRRRGLNAAIFIFCFFTITFYMSGQQSQRSQAFVEQPKLVEKRAHVVNEPSSPITFTSKTPTEHKEVIKYTDVTRAVSAADESEVREEITISATTTTTSTTTTTTATTTTTTTTTESKNKPLKNCKKHSAKLVGDMNSNPNITPTMDEVIKHVGPGLQIGGCYSPRECKALQKVAVLIPFKDRDAHLKTLLYYLHPMLMRQRLHYCIYVAEQFDNGQFNKATVMNAAFEEVLKLDNYSCIIFHDVDMIPENDNNFYMCGDQPRHLSPAIDKFQYKPHYGTDFGGVTGITVEQYRKANGHSNRFWGWGGEDNDMEYRIKYRNMSIVPSSLKIGRYKMIPHLHPWKFSPNKYPMRLNNTRKARADIDGLSDLQYTLLETIRHPMYTKLVIDIRKILVTKLGLYIDGKYAMDVDLTPGPCRYEEYPGKYLDFVIELTDKKEAQNIELWPALASKSAKSSLIKDNLIGPDGKKRRFSMLHDLQQAKDLCDKLIPECAGVERENSQENYSLRRGSIARHLVITGPTAPRPPTVPPDPNDPNRKVSPERRRYILPEKKAYLRYCPGEYSHFKPLHKPFMCTTDRPCPHNYSFEVYFSVIGVPTDYMYYTDEKHFESHLEKGENHYTFKWPRGIMPNFSDPKTVRKYSFRTPDFAIPNIPGTYAVESKIVDKLTQPYFQWNWWFEVTSGDTQLDAQARDVYWKQKMKENMAKGKALQHQAAVKEKQERARKNQAEFEKQMAKLKHRPTMRKRLTGEIADVIEKMQKQYDKHLPEGDPAAELLNPNDPIFQKNVGEIKVAAEVAEPKPTLKTTTTSKVIRIIPQQAQFHIGPPRKKS